MFAIVHAASNVRSGIKQLWVVVGSPRDGFVAKPGGSVRTVVATGVLRHPRLSFRPIDSSSTMVQALRSKAIRLLARRERSRSELRRLLDPEGAEYEQVSALLDELQNQGWLSEARLADQLIRGRRSRSSAARVRMELKRRGLDADVIAASTAGLDAGDLQTAMALLQRRFGEAATDRSQRERQMRFLLNRGFSRSIALKVILNPVGDVDWNPESEGAD